MRIFYLLLLSVITFSSLQSQSFVRGPLTNKLISFPLIADFNGDDKPDVLGISRFFSPTGDLRLHFNVSDDDGIMFETVDLDLDAFGNPGVGDFDGDDDMDIVIIEEESAGIVILLNNGDGTFESKPIDTEIAYFFRVADMDGDGDLDIVNLDGDSESVHIMINQGNADFTTNTLMSEREDLSTLELGDIDGDNDVDIIVGFENFFDGKVVLLENQGDASFNEEIITESALGRLEKIQIVDIDKDGHTDIVYSSNSTSFLRLLQNNGDDTFTESNLVQGLGRIRSFNVTDYNTDGIFDILIGCNEDDNTFHLGLSATSLEYDSEVVTGIQPMFHIVNGDLDSDGDLDAVISNGDFWWITNELEQFMVNVSEVNGTELSIYPNPFADQIHIESFDKDIKIIITDVIGQKVYESALKSNVYNLDFLKNGTYLLSIMDVNTGEFIQSTKIIKSR